MMRLRPLPTKLFIGTFVGLFAYSCNQTTLDSGSGLSESEFEKKFSRTVNYQLVLNNKDSIVTANVSANGASEDKSKTLPAAPSSVVIQDIQQDVLNSKLENFNVKDGAIFTTPRSEFKSLKVALNFGTNDVYRCNAEGKIRLKSGGFLKCLSFKDACTHGNGSDQRGDFAANKCTCKKNKKVIEKKAFLAGNQMAALCPPILVVPPHNPNASSQPNLQPPVPSIPPQPNGQNQQTPNGNNGQANNGNTNNGNQIDLRQQGFSETIFRLHCDSAAAAVAKIPVSVSFRGTFVKDQNGARCECKSNRTGAFNPNVGVALHNWITYSKALEVYNASNKNLNAVDYALQCL